MPYTQEQYQRAKSAVSSGAIPPDKVSIVQQRITEFEDDQARGYKRAPEAPAQPTLGEVDAQFGPSYLAQSKSPTAEAIRQTGEALTPEAMAARRQQVDWSKKLTTDPTLKNASKLHVFNDPPDYEPPKDLPGSGFLPKPTTSYFEPTAKEFREVMLSNPRIKSRLQEQYPEQDVEKIPEAHLAESDAFKAYADARWQHALAGALKAQTPITRVEFSDKTGVIDPEGKRKLTLTGHAAYAGDAVKSLVTGGLQGFTGGLYDLALSSEAPEKLDAEGNVIAPRSQGLRELRDAGRESRERNPITGSVGTVGGAVTPMGVPAKLAGALGKGLSRVVRPKSLPGRVAAGAAVGAATGVIDENMRAAADLAADALDAEKTARESVLGIIQGLPGINPVTAGAGAAIGGAADLLGAGAGAGQRVMTQSDRLRAPLKHFEESGGRMGPLMGRKVSPEAEAYQARADSSRTTPQDLIVDEIADPLASQRLLEQESALRGMERDTSIAQAKLEGVDLPVQDAVAKIQADASMIPGGTPGAQAAKKQMLNFANRLAAEKTLTADRLDEILREVDAEAGYARTRGEPKEHWAQVGKNLRELRDELRYREEPTVVNEPTNKGVFTADPDVTIAEPNAKPIGGVRDKRGNVKPVQDYSAEKLRQSKLQGFHKDMNKRLGLPEELQADTVLSEPVVSKGLFDVKTPQEIVEAIPPKARLNEDQRVHFEGAIRKTSGRDYLKNRREMEGLAERADDTAEAAGRKGDMPIVKKLQVVRQLDDRDQLSQALGAAVDSLNSTGYANVGMLKRIGFRAIPTLKSLSGGLPAKPVTPGVSDKAVARLRRFIPELEALHLRGGKPARVLGAAREDEEPREGEFSTEEKEFWMKVIEKITEQNKPQKVAGK